MAAAAGHWPRQTAKSTHPSKRFQQPVHGHVRARELVLRSCPGRASTTGLPERNRWPSSALAAAHERQSMPTGHHLGPGVGRHMCVCETLERKRAQSGGGGNRGRSRSGSERDEPTAKRWAVDGEVAVLGHAVGGKSSRIVHCELLIENATKLAFPMSKRPTFTGV